jgi:hypothetical protein
MTSPRLMAPIAVRLGRRRGRLRVSGSGRPRRGGKPLTVYRQFLAPLLLHRVQEQQRRNEDLTTRLQRLSEQLALREGSRQRN